MGEPKCKPGEIIKCGDEIRLEHVSSKKNLHSRDYPCLVNPESQEVYKINLLLFHNLFYLNKSVQIIFSPMNF